MREVEIPDGKALFLERGHDEIPGRAVKLIRAAAASAATQFSEYPELLEAPREGETVEQRTERLTPRLSGLTLNVEQAMAWDNLREASVVALLKSWTLDRPLPTLATIGTLPEPLYDALLDAVGGISADELVERFEPNPERIDPETGEERPTTAFDGSDGVSKAEAESPSTSAPESAGENTSTASSTAA